MRDDLSPGDESPQSSLAQFGAIPRAGRDVYYTAIAARVWKIPEAGTRRRAEQLYQQLPEHKQRRLGSEQRLSNGYVFKISCSRTELRTKKARNSSLRSNR